MEKILHHATDCSEVITTVKSLRVESCLLDHCILDELVKQEIHQLDLTTMFFLRTSSGRSSVLEDCVICSPDSSGCTATSAVAGKACKCVEVPVVSADDIAAVR